MEGTIERLWRSRQKPFHERRGQAFIELALILPVLLLVILLGLDFGRVFFGWVGLQNDARHLANAAAINAEAWASPGDAAAQAYYQTLIDDGSLNCILPTAGALPTPTFPDGYDLGDPAGVSLTCFFQPITPLVANLFAGGVVVISADAVFPIRGTLAAAPPAPPTPPPTTVTLSLASPTLCESSCTIRLTASISSPSSSNVYIYLAYAGSANYGSSCVVGDGSKDYTRYPSGQSITILAGQTSKYVELTGCPDGVIEGSESIQITVSYVTNGTFGSSNCGMPCTIPIIEVTPTPTPSPTPTATPVPTPTPTPTPCTVPQLYGRSYSYATADAVWKGGPYNFTTTLGSSPAQPWTGGSTASKSVGGQSLPPGLQFPCGTAMTVCRVSTPYTLCPYHQ